MRFTPKYGVLLCALSVAACNSESPSDASASSPDAAVADAAPRDAADLGVGVDLGVGADAAPLDAAPGDAGGVGACGGRACRNTIEDLTQWAELARTTPDGFCEYDQELDFLIPKSAAAPYQDSFFVDAQERRHLLDFVRTDLADRYGAYTVEEYYRTFERGDMREYWTGKIRRRVVSAPPAQFDFELDEALYFSGGEEQAALEAIHQKLSASFSLPLGYGPRNPSAVRQAEGFTNPRFTVHLPGLCPGEGCAGGATPCVIIPAGGGEACGRFLDGRTIQVEQQQKIHLLLRGGSYALPASGSAPFSLVESGTFGPAALPITPLADGQVTATDSGGFRSWTYDQSLDVMGRTLHLRWDFYFSNPPTEPLVVREPFVEGRLQMYTEVPGGMSNDDLTHLGSCTAGTLPLFFAEARLAGGDSVLLEYRHQIPAAGSGPLLPVAARVRLGGAEVLVEDYPLLTYAGQHHNWNNQFWILFSQPMRYGGHDIYGIGIDEADFTCCPVDAVYTLDRQLQRLDTLQVEGYERSPHYF